MNRLLRSLPVALVFALASSSALAAEPTPEEVERARTFFNAGAMAYSAANYADAVRSLEQAYVITARPPVLFSLAQAERKLFLDKGDPVVLRHAIDHYKEYLDKVPSGGRRAEALDAKTELEARLARMDPKDAASGAAQAQRKPRVTVFSPTTGARASLDGGPSQELPYFADLEPGKHRVRVFGEGYFDAEQEISGDKNIDVPVSLALKEKPALVTVALSSSAEIFVDGSHVADVPLNRPLEIPSGPHIIAIARNGAKPWSREVVLERGKPFKVEPKLETSGQRLAAVTMLGTGGALLALGGILGVGALSLEDRVQELERKATKENLTPDELKEHNKKIDDRDDARTGALVFASVGAAAAIGGALLYVFDKPPVALVPPRSVEPTPKPQTPMEMSSLRPFPLLGPGVYGAGVGARF